MGARLTADRELVGSIAALVRRRVPPSEVDDIVQSTLAEAVASQDAPEDPNALRRWLTGVARHKVADFHRRRRREELLDSSPDVGHVPSHEERDLLRWARGQLPSDDAAQTLEWMMHEADGEKLEAIAERERIPATRVRQRVHRLRAFFRERWHREIALATLVVLLLAAAAWMLSRNPVAPPIANDPKVLPPAPTPSPTIETPREVAPPAPLPAISPTPPSSSSALPPPPVAPTATAPKPAPRSELLDSMSTGDFGSSATSGSGAPKKPASSSVGKKPAGATKPTSEFRDSKK